MPIFRIGIDARLYGEEFGGIGRYTKNLIGNLQTIDEDNEYLVFLRKKDFSAVDLPASNFRRIEADFPVYGLSGQYGFLRLLNRLNLSLVHFTHFALPVFYSRPFAVTIHDLIKHRWLRLASTTRSPLVYFVKHLGYRLTMKGAVEKSQQIIVPSNFVKQDILKHYSLARGKIQVVYEGAGDSKSETGGRKWEEVSAEYQIAKPYLLYVGSLYPYKNVETLIGVLKHLGQELKLVIVCGRSIFQARLRQIVMQTGMQKRVIWAGFVAEEDLSVVYQNAETFITASFEEGFGLPILEAMINNCPVVCSSAGSLPEVGGEAALYFDPRDEKEAALKIKSVLTDGDLRRRLIARGLLRIQQFRWAEMAKQTLAVYQKILTSKNS